MKKLNQNKTPYLDALKKYVSADVLPLDVPGHHMGNVSNKLKSFLGDQVYRSDVNAPIGLDNLANPHSVLKEAEDLFAEFAHADHSFFLINGTSSGILAMIMSVCAANDSIILPRNVHKSIISALILSGASPVYIMPKIDAALEIANQPSVDDYIKAMQRYPTAKAVFVINPTYFGAVSDLKRIVDEAHSRGMKVLVDEAHGAHYYFDKKGYATKGFHIVDNSSYYTDKKGKLAVGFKKIGKDKYYFGRKGRMAKGLREIDKHLYYFGKDGKMVTGKMKIGDKTYYFRRNGRLKYAK